MNPTLWIVVSAVGAAVIAALAILYRRAAARRELELADEILDEEIATSSGSS